MVTFASYALAALAGLLAIPVVVLVLEIGAAIALPRRERSVRAADDPRRRIAVLVPAHNESAGLRPTLDDIKAQLRAGDRLLVVADNCSDDTAAVAAAAGAEVIGRHDPAKIGKGYALDWGLRHLAADPPEIVIIVDADCRLAEDAVDRLASACAETRRPAQALYLMSSPDRSAVNYQVAEFAWRVKNWVRPLGLSTLRLPCQLVGTGMAFPWDVIHSADLASGQIVEDLKLGLDLARAGAPPLFCPSAVVTSRFPTSVEGAGRQRQRWEHGHIGMILSVAPRLVLAAVAGANLGLLALVLDLAVPPLFLLGLLATAAVVVTGLAACAGLSSAALTISAASLIAFMLAVVLSWCTHGRDILPPRALVSIGPYVWSKLRLYRRLLSHGFVSQWIRTDRK
jgi:cellulose synthase/poly-beta-1,6-N-acetylglucosamine synthase-like glycosyltransferase